MIYTISVNFVNTYGENSWSEKFTSCASKRAARSMATRYIKRHLFASDIDRIDKWEVTQLTDIWTIHEKKH